MEEDDISLMYELSKTFSCSRLCPHYTKSRVDWLFRVYSIASVLGVCAGVPSGFILSRPDTKSTARDDEAYSHKITTA